jgi:hypothetical protein
MSAAKAICVIKRNRLRAKRDSFFIDLLPFFDLGSPSTLDGPGKRYETYIRQLYFAQNPTSRTCVDYLRVVE